MWPRRSSRPSGAVSCSRRTSSIDRDSLKEIAEAYADEKDAVVPVRSVLKCEAETGVCRTCYGVALATGRALQPRRRGRDRRRPVDRRAGHAAHDAYVPHRWCGRRRHHPRSAACRRAVRGAQAEGRRRDGARVRQGRDRGRREVAQGHHPRRQGRGARLHVPAAHAAARATGRQDRGRCAAQRGLAVPGRAARDPRPRRDRALPRRRGAGGLQVAGRGHQRQAHRADRAPDAEARARRPQGRHGLPARARWRIGTSSSAATRRSRRRVARPRSASR